MGDLIQPCYLSMSTQGFIANGAVVLCLGGGVVYTLDRSNPAHLFFQSIFNYI